MFKVGDKVHFKVDTFIATIKDTVSKSEVMEVLDVCLLSKSFYELRFKDKIICAFEHELVSIEE